jgi:hypothetical protein
MKSKKESKAVDFKFDYEVFNDPLLDAERYIKTSFFIELLLHYCHKLDIPEIIFSNNQNNYYSLYLSRQKNKKYLDKILLLNDIFDISTNWSNKIRSILALKIYSKYEKKTIITDVPYKTKLLTQDVVDFYLDMQEQHVNSNRNGVDITREFMVKESFSPEDITNNRNYLSTVAYSNSYYSFGTEVLFKYLDELDDDKNYHVVNLIFKNVYYYNTIYSYLVNLKNKYNDDFITKSEFIKSDNLIFDEENHNIYKKIFVPKNTIIKLFNLLINTPKLGFIAYQKLNLKNEI